MKTESLKNITDKMRKYTPYEPPQPKNPNLPPTHNIILSASVKGSGKSYNCVLLLQEYEKEQFIASDGSMVRMRTMWFAGGTANSKQNAILDTLDTLHPDDRIDIEEEPEKQLKLIYASLVKERDQIEAYQEYIKTYKRFMKNVKSLTYQELVLLQYKKFVNPKDDNERPTDEYGNILENPRCVFLIFDDLVGSDIFSNNKRGNFINRLATKSRHSSDKLVGLNLFFISQSFKAIPSIVRRNTDVFVLLKSSNKEYILEAITEETSGWFSKEELFEVYTACNKVEYGALIISIHKKEKPENRLRLNWNNRIIRDQKYLEE